MLRSDIPEILFSCIKEDDPYRASKVFQIERWCFANWYLHEGYGEREHYFLAQVLSSQDCWKKTDSLHEVKLDRQRVGKKLIVPNLDNPFSAERYKIACRCCFEGVIIDLFEERKKRLLAQGGRTWLEHHLANCLGNDRLVQFWSYFVSGYISKLNLNCLHPYEYGLKCSIDLKLAEAVEFFWNKIKSLPEDELSDQKKDEIFMETAVRAAGSDCNSYPEIFEFCFSQISPDKYPELLKRDLAENFCYGSLSTLKNAFYFDKLGRLFDCLESSVVSEGEYHIWLKCIQIKDCSVHCANAGMRLFINMWMKEGFDSHRALVLKREITVRSCFLERGLLIPWIHGNCMEPVWAVLDKAGPDQIKEFMGSEQADYIRSVLKERDQDSLNKFLSYDKSIVEELENPSANLNEVSLSRAHEAKAT